MSATFESLGLSPESLATVRRARFQAPTPIQAQAIPPALAGRDVVGCAATGTGKTAAFLLPLVERLRGRGEEGTLALVLAPTRELVMQISEQARFFGEEHGLKHAVVIGGEDLGEQVKAVRERPTFLIATPGRLVDLLSTKSVNLQQVRALVLDEADRMLDMGFQPQLEELFRVMPRERQTLLFSATLGHDVTEFAQRVLRKPVRVEVTPSGTPAARAAQRLYEVTPEEKWALLFALLARDEESVLVFTATKQRADKVQQALKREGYKAACIHSERTQNQRKQALAGFERGQYRCLVATDIAARGLDVEHIGHVINFDLPHSPEDYVHRIGRTARAGASGRASTFVTEADAEKLQAVEKVIRARIPRGEVPRRDPVFQDELERFKTFQREADFPGVEREGFSRRPARKPAKKAGPPGRSPERPPARGKVGAAGPAKKSAPSRGGPAKKSAPSRGGPARPQGKGRVGAAGPAKKSAPSRGGSSRPPGRGKAVGGRKKGR